MNERDMLLDYLSQRHVLTPDNFERFEEAHFIDLRRAVRDTAVARIERFAEAHKVPMSTATLDFGEAMLQDVTSTADAEDEVTNITTALREAGVPMVADASTAPLETSAEFLAALREAGVPTRTRLALDAPDRAWTAALRNAGVPMREAERRVGARPAASRAGG